jgi:pimeloyl-ACP methyl ester carboxylesterase
MQKNKSPLVFLHGALGTSRDLEPLMTLMHERGFETYSFNFSGHGPSAAEPQEFRIDLFAHDLDRFLKKNQLNDPVIFGYSMGGYVALYHISNFEDSPISAIFTYGTKFNWSEKAVSKELPMMNPDYVLEKYSHFADSLKEKHGERWKQLLRSTAHMMQNLERLDGLTREDLSEIQIPVVLILGDLDRMVTSEETHLTGSWIHHAQVKTISHSKHELERSNLKEIADTIEEGLD